MNDERYMAYGDTAGFVDVDTSRDRAINEAQSGITNARARLILETLEQVPDGLTWSEMGSMLQMHHGQISGALSNLHKLGHVFMLVSKRKRSHPYVHRKFKNWYDQHERIDTPARTKSSIRRAAELRVMNAAMALVDTELFPDPELARAVEELRSIGRTNVQEA